MTEALRDERSEVRIWATEALSEIADDDAKVGVFLRVVDGETGRPIEQFVVEYGQVDDKDPTKVRWGPTRSGTNSPNPEGRFSEVQWGGGRRARILATGYLPQPILDQAPAAGVKQVKDRVVRLKRASEIAGRVLYHDGSPAADVPVFLLDKWSALITRGNAWDCTGRIEADNITRTTTDSAGRFKLPGGNGERAIAVSSPRLDVWAVPAPDTDATSAELTIKLPQAGRLIVRYDIAGGDAKTKLFVELHDADLPASWGVIPNRYEPVVSNGGQVVLDNLPPGHYDLARQKHGSDRAHLPLRPPHCSHRTGQDRHQRLCSPPRHTRPRTNYRPGKRDVSLADQPRADRRRVPGRGRGGPARP